MKRITILGAGISGVGAAKLAIKENYSVFVSDHGSINNIHKETLDQLGISYEEGTHDYVPTIMLNNDNMNLIISFDKKIANTSRYRALTLVAHLTRHK